MSRISLSDAGDWQLKFPDSQDIRGFRALDKDGTEVGIVDTMIVNTDLERVDAILLEDGSEYPARDLTIGDGVVYLTGADASTADLSVDEEVRVYGDDGHVVRRAEVGGADYDAHADAFRTHHASSYGDADDFGDTEPAYRYGFDAGHEDTFKNRPFVDAETDLRSAYTTQHADRDYDTDRDALRYGYTRAQHGTR